jgi:hypothetical protein
MKTEIAHVHRRGELGSVTDLNANPVSGTKAKTSTILRAAAQVFAERGYQAATIDAVAEHAGIAREQPTCASGANRSCSSVFAMTTWPRLNGLGKPAIEHRPRNRSWNQTH